MNLELLKQIYPPYEDGSFRPVGDYTPLLQSFGEVLVRVEDDGWQGDTRSVIKKDNKYGYLCFGWGSCSGCDALQACNSYEDVEELRVSLETSIKWYNSAAELLHFINTHDWEGDYAGLSVEIDEFIKLSKEVLEKISIHPHVS